MKIRFDEEKIISIKNIIISDKEADKLLYDLKRAIEKRKSGEDVPKIEFGNCSIIINSLIQGS